MCPEVLECIFPDNTFEGLRFSSVSELILPGNGRIDVDLWPGYNDTIGFKHAVPSYVGFQQLGDGHNRLQVILGLGGGALVGMIESNNDASSRGLGSGQNVWIGVASIGLGGVLNVSLDRSLDGSLSGARGFNCQAGLSNARMLDVMSDWSKVTWLSGRGGMDAMSRSGNIASMLSSERLKTAHLLSNGSRSRIESGLSDGSKLSNRPRSELSNLGSSLLNTLRSGLLNDLGGDWLVNLRAELMHKSEGLSGSGVGCNRRSYGGFRASLSLCGRLRRTIRDCAPRGPCRLPGVINVNFAIQQVTEFLTAQSYILYLFLGSSSEVILGRRPMVEVVHVEAI